MGLPTYQECLDITKKNPSFILKEEFINETKIHIFKYMLAPEYNFFVKHPEAKELRGITFVFDKKEPNRYLALKKFFNLNENIDTQYDVLRGVEIKRIQNKMDGSLIQFIPFKSHFHAKTISSFFSDQAKLSQEILENNPRLEKFLNICQQLWFFPFFEYVSKKNQIVINYPEESLKLIQIRCNRSGKYIDYNVDETLQNFIKFCKIEATEDFPITNLDNLINKCETDEKYEGYVVTFKNGKQIKLKTKWYHERHHLLTQDLMRENTLINLILNNQIDDALLKIPNDDERKINAQRLSKFLSDYINKTMKEVEKIVCTYNKYKSRKDFVNVFKNSQLFPTIMESLKDPTSDGICKTIIRRILRQTYHLQEARAFLKRQGFEI